MTDEEKERARDIGDEAIEYEPGPEQQAFIDEQCAGFPQMAQYVRRYLAVDDGPDSREFTQPVIHSAEPYAQHLGRRIGPWTLIKFLGEGAFGVVFLAERKNPIQRAAVKLLQGTVRSRDLEIRFRQEHQALAKLNHPNIVHFLDAGLTADEQAYVVMEYIEDAQSIDAYCRSKRQTVRETIKLFELVCEAVAEAHRNQIVHRDLKPGNILVGKNGIPKLVDFNLAKLLDPADQGAQAQSFQVQIGTARYMSPEQALRRAGNTTTDVYSLGLVLYELLTGTDPYDFDRRVKDSVEKIICEVDAEPASQAIRRSRTRSIDKQTQRGDRALKRLGRELSGDIDTILGVALCKEPERRYQSVDAFRADLQRHLNLLPIIPRGDSVLYRARRFVRRNLAWTIGVTAASLSLIVGLITTAHEWRRAEQEASNTRTALIGSLLSDAELLEADNPDQGLAYGASALRLASTSSGIENSETFITRGALSISIFSREWWLPVTLMRHGSSVVAAAFSTDGRQVVTASFDHTARIWDATTGNPVGSPLQHGDVVNSAVFSPDGHRVITASADHTARIWDAVTGSPIGSPLRHGDIVYSAAFSADGLRVVTASEDHTARIWDATTGNPIGSPLRHRGGVRSAGFSPNGRRVVTASADHTARIWDAITGNPIGSPLKHGDFVYSAVFSPDGRRIVTASDDHTARIWDAATGNPIGSPLKHGDLVYSAVFSPDGRRIVTASDDDTARIWDAVTGNAVGRPLQHGNHVWSAAFSPDGNRVVTASANRSARVWDVVTGIPIGSPLRHGDVVYRAAFSPDGRRVVTASRDGTAGIWDISNFIGPPLLHGKQIWSVAFSPDGSRIVTASEDHTARIWDAATSKPIGSLLQHDDEVNSAAFSPDGRRIVTASSDHTARIWDATTGNPVGLPLKHGDIVYSATFSPDGRRVVTASEDHTARIWDAATGNPIGSPLGHGDVVYSAVFSPDGLRVVTASEDHTARIWDAVTGNPIGSPLKHSLGLISAAFSPDGRRVVTASDDRTARIWDATTGNPIGLPLKHGDIVNSAVFSPDGHRVITASDDDTARIWDAVTGNPIGPPLRHNGAVNDARFSPDGRLAVTGSDDDTARIWDATAANPIGPPLRHDGSVDHVAFSPDGRRIVTSAVEVARVWTVLAGLNTARQTGQLADIAEIVGGYRISESGVLVALPLRDRVGRVDPQLLKMSPPFNLLRK